MDAVALLDRARKVGLRVEPIGDKLLVRGPKRAEAVVELLAAHKAEVLAALAPCVYVQVHRPRRRGSWHRSTPMARSARDTDC